MHNGRVRVSCIMRKRVVLLLIGAALSVTVLAVLLAWSGNCIYPEGPEYDAESRARIIRTASQYWQAAHNQVSCPTLEQLIAEKQLDLDPGHTANDPWNQPYQLRCTDADVIVSSSGADRRFGTADDLVVPSGEVRP